MESFPGPHNYMRPPLPPSSMADPHHNQPPPPPPHASPWYPPQFQYHPSHSPSPPPPPQHWGPLPPPPPDHIHGPPPYAPHPNPHYPPHPYPNQYPPPQQRPHLPPPPPPPPYASTGQEWGNQSWVPHAGWEQQAHNNGEDWAAKARAWATAKNAMENQHPLVQSQYPSMQTSESHYHDNEQINVQQSTYQNYPVPAEPMDKQHMVNQPDPAVRSVNAYYAPDVNFSYARKDGKFSDTGTAYPEQDSFMSSSVHKQEVPSSYSSIPGGYVSTGQQSNGSSTGECILADRSQFPYGSQSAAVRTDPCDQPLQFTARFNHDNNPMMSAGYPDTSYPANVMDSNHVPTLHPWTPPPPPMSFQSVPPTFPSAAQLDPTISMAPLAGQPPLMLGRPPVPSFQSTASLSSPVGFGTGTSVHPATAFHGDIYGTPMNSDRPKKAAVPNWLRDEIIKKKDTIVSFGTDHHKADSESIDDETVDKSAGKSDQADSKSIDSSRSTEEDEDEDYEEAARTAAINQEIKRVLTDVLLKVTSDLFDEIATRVLSEDDHSIEAKNDTNAQNQKLSAPLASSASASKVSEKVLIPTKTKDVSSEGLIEKSSSQAAGSVLGLVNYASDDEEEELEIGGFAVPKSQNISEITSSGNKDIAEGRNCTVEHNRASQLNELFDQRSNKNGVGPPKLTKPIEGKNDSITDHGRAGSFDDSRDNHFSRKETKEPEAPTVHVRKASNDNIREKDTSRRDRHENRISSARDSVKEIETTEAREINKEEQSHGKHDERHHKKKYDDLSGYKERSKEQGLNLDHKKQSPHRHTKEFKEVNRLKKVNEKDDVRRKSERSDRSRHKYSDRGRYKRRRSSSNDSRDVHRKDNSVASDSDNSTDDASEKSKRKVHSKQRNLSPSPVRSRRRQVSQSPPSSKASQRRHSPYSSLEPTSQDLDDEICKTREGEGDQGPNHLLIEDGRVCW
ncbi:hypothetical protein V2J09_013123 [Rumex salicifolius]